MGFKNVAVLTSMFSLVLGHINHDSGSWQNGGGRSYGDTSAIVSARSSSNSYRGSNYNPAFRSTDSTYWDGGKPNLASASTHQRSQNSYGPHQYGRSQGRNQNTIQSEWDTSPYSGNGLGKSWAIYNMNWGDSGLRSSNPGNGRGSSNGWGSSGISGGWGGLKSSNSGWDTSGLTSSGWGDSRSKTRPSYGAGDARFSGGWSAANARSSNSWDSGSSRFENSWGGNNNVRSSSQWPDSSAGYSKSDNQRHSFSW